MLSNSPKDQWSAHCSIICFYRRDWPPTHAIQLNVSSQIWNYRPCVISWFLHNLILFCSILAFNLIELDNSGFYGAKNVSIGEILSLLKYDMMIHKILRKQRIFAWHQGKWACFCDCEFKTYLVLINAFLSATFPTHSDLSPNLFLPTTGEDWPWHNCQIV